MTPALSPTDLTSSVSDWPPDLREEHSERAGIVAADTGCTREE